MKFSFFGRFKQVPKPAQSCECYCPNCSNELISSKSFVSDEELVTYKCSNCKIFSHWSFDTPVPLLIKHQFEFVLSGTHTDGIVYKAESVKWNGWKDGYIITWLGESEGLFYFTEDVKEYIDKGSWIVVEGEWL